MDQHPAHSALDRLLDTVTNCLTAEAAKKLIDLRADAVMQERVDELADKSTAGILTSEERLEYEGYITASTVIGIMQSKARKLLATQSAA